MLGAYTPAEQERTEQIHDALHARVQKILAKHQTQRVERLIRHVTMSTTGRIGIKQKEEGFNDRPATALLESICPKTAAIYIISTSGLMGRPLSAYSDYGVPFGEPSGEYSALKIDLQPTFEASQILGLAEAWEPFDNLCQGEPLQSQRPDIQHLANVTLIGFEHPRTRPAITLIPGPKTIDKKL